LDIPDEIFTETVPFQSDKVKPPELCRPSLFRCCDSIGEYILTDHCSPADHGKLADSCELVHCTETAENHVIFDHNMAGKGCGVRHYHIAADNAVMGNMRV